LSLIPLRFRHLRLKRRFILSSFPFHLTFRLFLHVRLSSHSKVYLRDLDKHNLIWWFDFVLAAPQRNTTHFKSGQKKVTKNNYLTYFTKIKSKPTPTLVIFYSRCCNDENFSPILIQRTSIKCFKYLCSFKNAEESNSVITNTVITKWYLKRAKLKPFFVPKRQVYSINLQGYKDFTITTNMFLLLRSLRVRYNRVWLYFCYQILDIILVISCGKLF